MTERLNPYFAIFSASSGCEVPARTIMPLWSMAEGWMLGITGNFQSEFTSMQATQDKDGSAHSNNGPEPPPPLTSLLGKTCLIDRQFKMDVERN